MLPRLQVMIFHILLCRCFERIIFVVLIEIATEDFNEVVACASNALASVSDGRAVLWTMGNEGDE
jgi:hypothetical protein